MNQMKGHHILLRFKAYFLLTVKPLAALKDSPIGRIYKNLTSILWKTARKDTLLPFLFPGRGKLFQHMYPEDQVLLRWDQITTPPVG